ncbi:MAG TPA: ABC-F family ATP-binding cassette domain-containing protein [Microbacteriaceae bacterium]|nr:ABC-F family ATP-binding cassette domain-containing protein [Microbacteriaceae bacterium]
MAAVIHLLGAEAIHLEYPNRRVLESVTLGLNAGERIGIVGRNGDGKSTLLRILAGDLEPDSGQVTRRGGTRIGMLQQSDAFGDSDTVSRVVVGDRADHEWAGDARIRGVLAGLLGDVDWGATIGSLSGGQRRRVALAQLLAGDWDVLFLDEPTNHLDVEGVAWLAEHLTTRWPAGQGAFAVVTHDRWFLDEVCQAMWEVHDGIVDAFEGGYAAYVLQRVERDRQAAAIESKRQNLMRKELAWLRRGAPARTSKPKFRIDAANALIANEPPIRNAIALEQLAVSRLGKDVVDLEHVSMRFADRDILRDVTWRIAPGERAGILGVNGAGKSTLLDLITGVHAPTTGRVKRGKTVKIAVLSQQLDELSEWADERVSDIIARQRTSYQVGDKEFSPGQLLERLGFESRQLATPIGNLSGGQKRRLQFLLILLNEPNVLILDEPTNDLDTDMLAAMEDLLDSWPGTLIVVSHDRYLLERVTDVQYAVMDGHLRHLPRGIDEYLERSREAAGRRAADRTRASVGEPATSPAPGSGSAAKATASALGGAERRSAEKEISSIDRKLSRLAEEITAAHERLAAHDQSDYAGLAAHAEALRALEEETSRLEERWLELGEFLEA